MPSDVLITPASNKIDFTDGANATKTLKITGTSFSFDSDLGIGITNPTEQSNYRFLQVNGTNSAVIETMVGGTRIGGFDSTSNTLFIGTIGSFPIVFRTAVDEKWRIASTGILQSNGAQTIQTSTGNLTLATAAGNGHIILSNHGTGNVGIGAATPSQKLEVQGNIKLGADNAGSYIYYVKDNEGTIISTARSDVTQAGLFRSDGWGNFTVDKSIGIGYSLGTGFASSTIGNGNLYVLNTIGINTTSPLTKLDVRGGSITSGTATSTTGSTIIAGYYVSGALTVLGTEQSSGGPVLGYAVTPSTSATGAFLSSTTIAIPRSAYTQDGGTHRWYIGASQTVAIGSAVTTSEVMRINSSGNLGIGTTSPSQKLHVLTTGGSTTAPNIVATFQANTATTILAGGGTAIKFVGVSSGGNLQDYDQGMISTLGYTDNNRHGMQFWVKPNASTVLTVGQTIDSNGNVGIGITSPSYKLDVIGRISYNGAISEGADATLSSSGTVLLHGNSSTWTEQRFYTLGSQRLTINSSGNVGVGTTSPATLLHVDTTGTDARIRVSAGANTVQGGMIANSGTSLIYAGSITNHGFSLRTNDTDRVRIDTSGNVGIGITSPTYKLDVNGTFNATGTSTLAGVSISGTINSSATEAIRINNNNGYISIYNSAGTTRTGYIQGLTAGSLVLSAENGALLQFLVGGSERVRVDTNGNLGVGTTTAYTRTHIYGTLTVDAAGATVNSFTEGIRLGAASNGYSIVTFGVNAGASSGAIANQWWIGKHGGDNSFNFNSQGGGDVFRILQGGNVGIGNTTPGYKLHVNGNGYFNSTLQVNSNITLSGGGDVIINDSDGTGTFNSFMDSGVGYIRIDDGGSANGALNINSGTLFVGPSSGNVGIGITSPAFKLDVSGSFGLNAGTNDGNWPFIIVDSSSSGGANRYALNKIGAMGFNYADSYAQLQLVGASGAYIDFNNAATDDTDARIIYYSNSRFDLQYGTTLTINSTGLGVGTNSFGEKLVVAGNSLIYGNTGAVGTGTAYYLGDTANSRDLAITRVGGSAMAIGRYFPSAWVETIRFTNVGDVGIGISTPLAKLHVNSTTSGATLLRADGTNGTLFSVVDDLSDSLMSVNNSAGLPVLEVFADDRVVAGQYGANDFVLVNNKLGLGTNNPQYELDIVGPGTNAAVNIITRIRSTASSNTFDTASVIAFTNTTTNTNAYSYIGSRIDLGSAGDNAQALIFATNATNTLPTEKMRIKSDGNVGIGTTSPGAKLHIQSGSILVKGATTPGLNLEPSGAVGNADISFNGASFILVSNSNSADLRLSTNSTPRLTILANGNVGIGTTAPAALLQIGTGTPTSATGGIQFGDDTGARLYRSSSGVVSISNSFAAAGGYVYASNYLQTGNNLIYPAGFGSTQRLEVGNAAQNAWITGISIAPGGNVVVAGTLTESSSIRYKENIKTISAPILPKLNKIRPVTYNKKDNPNNTEYGIIAEELNELFPELVNKNDNGEVESVNYSRLTVLLIKAVKELKQEIEILKNK